MDFINKHSIKFSKLFILSVFFALYLGLLWFSFSSKGIYADGHFYKKSANMTTITYTCRNPFARHKEIVLQKQVNKNIITIDNTFTVSVHNDGTVTKSDNMSDDILPDTDWTAIARQDTESSRGTSTRQPYFLVFIVYGLFTLSKIYSASVYGFFFKNRAAGESYYRIFDIVFTVVTAVVMVYFILPV